MKVFDLINFFQEMGLLEIRLNTLDPIVDYFIISESNVTFSGIPKPYYYLENKDRYKKFEHKIISQIVTDTPEDYLHLSPDSAKDPLHRLVIERVNKGDWWPHTVPTYGRNTYQKECLVRATTCCKPDDIILTSDTDEIFNPVKVKEVIDNFDPNQVYNFRNRNYIFYFNLVNGEPWLGGHLLTCKKLQTEVGLCELKMRRRGIFIEDGGWHFSYMGGTDAVKEKLDALDDPELQHNKGDIRTIMANCISKGIDLYGKKFGMWKVPIDSSFPKYIVDHQDQFRDFIY